MSRLIDADALMADLDMPQKQDGAGIERRAGCD